MLAQGRVTGRSAPAAAEEEGLIARAARGDRDAFGRLYQRYFPRVYRHIRHLNSEPELAEDLAAQTFLNALQAIDRFELRGVPFLAWLLRIATNLTINHLKGERANGSAPLPPTLEAQDIDASPEESCQTKVDGERLWQLVRRLRRDQRQVIVMRFLDGLSYQDIAQVLGKSPGAVRVIQYRALANLRRLAREDAAARRAALTGKSG